MRSIVLGGVAATILLAVAGCAAPGTGGASAPAAPVPTGAEVQAQLAELPTPSADSPVLAIATVLEQDGTAILCVGPVAESAPPQCDGPRRRPVDRQHEQGHEPAVNPNPLFVDPLELGPDADTLRGL